MASRSPNIGSSGLADLAVRTAGRLPRVGVAQNLHADAGLRKESVRVGWSMSILRRRRLVCRALSEATLADDTARLRSMLKPDGTHFDPWIHDHG